MYQIKLRDTLFAAGLRVELDHDIDFCVDLYRLDLAVPERRIAVELGGNSERASGYKLSKRHKFFDEDIEPYMQSIGWRTFRFSPEDLDQDLLGCARRIVEAAAAPLRAREDAEPELKLPDPEVIMPPARVGKGARWFLP